MSKKEEDVVESTSTTTTTGDESAQAKINPNLMGKKIMFKKKINK